MLDVFISWSGTLSQEVALYFRELLPELLPNTKPWVSTEDIPKGEEWFQEILKTIGRTPVCIILVTKQNLRSSWIYFEAGGIKFAMKKPKLCAYLLDVEPGQISSTPLGQMQCTRVDQKDTWRLIRDINLRLETPHDQKLLKVNFDNKWPEIEQKIRELLAEHTVDDPDEIATDTIELSECAKAILLEAVQCPDGVVMTSFNRGGYSVQTNDKTFVPDRPRDEAEFRAAIQELESNGMIEDMAGKGEVYFVRKPAFVMGDTLRAAAEAQKPTPEPNYSDTDLINVLHDWFGKQGFEGGTEVITFAKVDAELKIPPGSTKRLLAQAMADRHYHPVPGSIGEHSMRISYVEPESSFPTMSNPGWDDPNNPYGRRH